MCECEREIKMVVSCSVPYCTSKRGKSTGISFHEFPSNLKIRNQWLKKINRQGPTRGSKWMPLESSSVCSLHFLPTDYKPNCRTRVQLVASAVPTVFTHSPHYKPSKEEKRRRILKRVNPEEKLNSEKSNQTTVETQTELQSDTRAEEQITQTATLKSFGCQTESLSIKTIKQQKLKLAAARSKISKLKAKVNLLQEEIATLKRSNSHVDTTAIFHNYSVPRHKRPTKELDIH